MPGNPLYSKPKAVSQSLSVEQTQSSVNIGNLADNKSADAFANPTYKQKEQIEYNTHYPSKGLVSPPKTLSIGDPLQERDDALLDALLEKEKIYQEDKAYMSKQIRRDVEERRITAEPKLDVKLAIEDNVLSTVDNQAYKFKLFIAAPEDAFSIRDPRKVEQQITIAESGNSGSFYIRSVNIESAVGPNIRTKNMPVNQFTLDIVEPRGFSLFDAMLRSCVALGIPNYMAAPYYLQLDFLTYDENGLPITISNASKIWSIKITNVKSNSSHEGTVYSVEAIEMEHVTTSNRISVTQTHNFIAADTIGTFFKKLETSMNSVLRQELELYRDTADEIIINVDNEISSLSAKSPADQYDPKNLASDKFYVTQEKLINVPKGMDISSIVDHLMVANEAWAKLWLLEKNTEDETKTEKNFVKIWMIDTNVEYIKYDYNANDYARRFIFNIRPYNSIKNVVEPGKLIKNYDNKEIQTSRLKELIKTFDIKKSYDYMYTGINTEVLDFDINLDYMWVSSMPLYRGLNRKNAPDAGSEVQEADKFRYNVKQYAADSKRSSAGDTAAEERLKNASTQGDVNRDSFRRQLGLLTSSEVDNLEQIAAQRKSRGVQYVEDILKKTRNLSIIADNTEESNEDQTTLNPALPLPYGMNASGNDPEISSSLLDDGTRKRYRSVAGAILNNIFQTGDMLSLELQIKGDPYWLGISRTEDRLGLLSNINYVNPNDRDNLFILRFKFPDSFDDENGLNQSIHSDTITGLYGVLMLKSRFEDGQFIQELSAYKDVNTNLLLAEKGII